MSDDKPTMELTRNPVDGSYGFICREHGIHRSGLTHQHAINVERKHQREDHPDPLELELDLRAGAIALTSLGSIDRWAGATDVWMALTGLEGHALEKFLDKVAEAPEPVRVAVVPF